MLFFYIGFFISFVGIVNFFTAAPLLLPIFLIVIGSTFSIIPLIIQIKRLYSTKKSITGLQLIKDIFLFYGKDINDEKLIKLSNQDDLILQLKSNIQIPSTDEYKKWTHLNIIYICKKAKCKHQKNILDYYNMFIIPTLTEETINFLYNEQRCREKEKFLGYNYNSAACGICFNVCKELGLNKEQKKIMRYAKKMCYTKNF